VKYIFFDFDGTISDAKKVTYEALAATLVDNDYKFNRAKLKKLMGLKTQQILAEFGIDKSNVKKVKAKFFSKAINDVLTNGLKLCAPVEPLYQLKKGGVKLIVLSNAEKSFLDASIKVLGLKKLFNKVYGSRPNDTKDKILKKLFKKYNIRAKDVIYVGDRFTDIEYAHKAHCIAVATHNKCAWSTKKQILDERPDYIISNFKELKEIVERLNSKLNK